MGREKQCDAILGDQSGRVVAHLDADKIVLRGEFAAKVPLRSARSLRVDGERLRATTELGELTLLLGAKEAQAWLSRISDPPTLIRKLGVGVDTAVHVAGAHPMPTAVLTDAGARMVSPEEAQLIFVVVESQAQLETLAQIAAVRPSTTQIWVLRLKGKDASIKESVIMERMRLLGMAPSKTAAWSDRYAVDRYGTARTTRS